jgi:hypothetical protein
MCANISYILMNVNRYMLIGREHKPLFEKISKWNSKWVVVVTFAFSALVNVGHGFQYSLNNGSFYTWNIPNYYLYIVPTYPDEIIINYSLPLYIYTLIYFIVNYVLFFVVNTWVEVTIVSKLHSELASKKTKLNSMSIGVKRLSRLSVANLVAVFSAPTSFRKRRKREIEEGAERRAIIMVVMNALINFLFRLPELLVLLAQSEPLFKSNVIYGFFSTFQSLPIFPSDLTYLFYILTLSANFLI